MAQASPSTAAATASASTVDERTALLHNSNGTPIADGEQGHQEPTPDASGADARAGSSRAGDGASTSQPRPSSYIIVTAPTSDNNRISLVDTLPGRHAQAHPHPPLPPPRFRLLLPLFALVDLCVSLALLVIAYDKYAEPDLDRDGAQQAAEAAQRMAFSLFACAVIRCIIFAGVGISKHTRSMSVFVAAASLLSILFIMSMANMLLEAHALRTKMSSLAPSIMPSPLMIPPLHLGALKLPELPLPVLPLFAGQQLLFTILNWALFIAVVGVRLPPGRNPVKARRWARTLDQHRTNGLDARSLLEHDGDEDEEDEDSASDLDEHEHSSFQRRVDEDGDQGTISSSVRPIAPRSPTFPMGSPSPAPSLSLGQGARTGGTSSVAPAAASIDSAAGPSSGAARQTASPSQHELDLHLATSELSLPPAMASPTRLEEGALRQAEYDDDGEDDDEQHDPQDIIDIPSDKRLSRQESRRRLAKAYARSNASSTSLASTLPGLLVGSGSGPSGTATSSRRSYVGDRRDSTISVRSYASSSTTTGAERAMGLPISSPSMPDRRTSTSLAMAVARAQSPPLVGGGGGGTAGAREGPSGRSSPVSLVNQPSARQGSGVPPARGRSAQGSAPTPPSAAGKATKAGKGRGIGGLGLGRRPSWLGGSKREGGGSGGAGAGASAGGSSSGSGSGAGTSG